MVDKNLLCFREFLCLFDDHEINTKITANMSSCFFFYFAGEVKRGPWDHLVPMFTNCQIKEATQVGHHVNQLDGRSLNVYNVLIVFLIFTNIYISISIKK